MLSGRCYPTWAFSIISSFFFFVFFSWPCKTFSWPCKTPFFVLCFYFLYYHQFYIKMSWCRVLTIFSPFPSNSSSPSLSIPPELWAVWIRLNNISLQNHPIKCKSKTSRSSCKRWSLTCHVGFTFSYMWTTGGRNQQVWAKCSLRSSVRALKSTWIACKSLCLSFSVKNKERLVFLILCTLRPSI